MPQEPTKYDAFLSYAHVDDEMAVSGETGDVSKFHAALQVEMRKVWKRDCLIFIDRDVRSGDRWREVLDTRLGEVNFMVAMLSPGFFDSPECRAEVGAFLDETSTAGHEARLFPVLVEDISLVVPDHFLRKLMARQHTDYRKVKFEATGSKPFREFVSKFALDVRDSLHRPTSTAGRVGYLVDLDYPDQPAVRLDAVRTQLGGKSGYNNHFVLWDPHRYIGRRRAEILRRPDGTYQLKPLSFVNPTWINGMPVTEGTPLDNGAIVEFGNRKFRFEIRNDHVAGSR